MCTSTSTYDCEHPRLVIVRSVPTIKDILRMSNITNLDIYYSWTNLALESLVIADSSLAESDADDEISMSLFG